MGPSEKQNSNTELSVQACTRENAGARGNERTGRPTPRERPQPPRGWERGPPAGPCGGRRVRKVSVSRKVGPPSRGCELAHGPQRTARAAACGPRGRPPETAGTARPTRSSLGPAIRGLGLSSHLETRRRPHDPFEGSALVSRPSLLSETLRSSCSRLHPLPPCNFTGGPSGHSTPSPGNQPPTPAGTAPRWSF